MATCGGTYLKMVQAVVSVIGGRVYIFDAAAGYVDAGTTTCASALTTSSLTAPVVLAAWNSRTTTTVATCDPWWCYGYGIRTLVYTIQGIF